MLLTYDAIDSDGKSLTDSIEAADPREALDTLRRRGLFVTEIHEESSKKKSKTGKTRGKDGSARMSVKALSMLTRQMAMMMRAGSGVVPAIQAIRKQSSNPKHHAMFDKILYDLEEGMTLTDALRKHPRVFDSTFCAIVQAGEASATLTEMFERLAIMVGKRKAMRNKILGAMAYPALLTLMSVKIVAIMLFFVLPRFAGMFESLGAEIPFTTQIMISASTTLKTNWIVCAAIAVGAVFGLIWAVQSPIAKQWICNIQTKIPLVGGLFSRLIQGQLFRTMGLLLESRVGVLDALDLSRGVTKNKDFGNLFDHIESSVTGGGQISAAFENIGLVEPYICQAIKTGEDSGNLGGAMTYVADILDESNTELVNAATKLIEPMILIGMGLVVGGVAVSLFMPLFDMTGAIG